MFWLVVIYMFLFVFRPFEVWPFLGALHLERMYMLFLMMAVFIWNYKKYIPHKINTAVFLFLFTLILSSLTAFKFQNGWDVTVNYGKLLMFYFILILTIRNVEELKKFIIAYILVMFLYMTNSAMAFLIGGRSYYTMDVTRMIGIDKYASQSNLFATTIVYTLPLLWALLKCKVNNVWLMRTFWAYAPLALFCIIRSASRTGMVSLLLFFLLIWLGASKKMLYFILIVIVLIAAWSFMPEEYQNRFMTIFDKGVGPDSAYISAQGRIEGLKQGIKTFKRYPILGIGPDNFIYCWDKDSKLKGMQAHNLYGQILGELGAIGVLTFSLLLWYIITTHQQIIKKVNYLEGVKMRSPALLGRSQELNFIKSLSIASLQIMVLLLFNGNFGHNAYRYPWLWVGAFGILLAHFLKVDFEPLDKAEAEIQKLI